MEKAEFTAGEKTLTLFPADGTDRPLIVFSGEAEDAEPLRALLRAPECPDHSLLAVGGLDWERDLTPGPCPPVFKNGPPCAGGADAYLRSLLTEILPLATSALRGTPRWTGIAGYSLAGLFALYALYRTDVFSRAASVSGSLWFPGFIEFARREAMPRRPDRLYLSLGDREAKTKHPLMQTVQVCTEEYLRICADHGIDAVFERNPGGHFRDAALRIAKGIRAILTD